MENLFKKYLDNQCSPEELKKLLSFFSQPENEAMFRKLINDTLTCSDDNEKIGQEIIPPDKIFHEMKNQLENEKISLITFLKKTNLQAATIAFILFENNVMSAS
jgi:hypothetical protein